ncbi:ANK domain containing protein [uncultured Caudovirales phage]|uniref:ANK domain containing protein n=1 Tax=uncultured Caudovirales phage TaxID=2100421 RepID=A0A6J5KSQ8_9CAUD|nr:ANK domain containing protein [uncultured Caudovirales phage]CAB4240749.1 ANK domain containing protein [uncultured Caudovirales phage]
MTEIIDEAKKLVEDKLINLTLEQKKDVLLRASHDNSLPHVLWLLDNGIDINTQDKEGWTALLLAVKMGYVLIAGYLISQGADLDYTLKGRSALMMAVAEKNLEIVKLIVKKYECRSTIGVGIVINQCDYNGASLPILLIASNVDNQNGSSTTETDEELEILDFLISHGVRVGATDKNGFTALMWAAASNKLKTARILIKNGAKVNNIKIPGYNSPLPVVFPNPSKMTALMGAALNGHLEMCKLLIENGANARAKNKDGKMAIMLAGDNQHWEVVKYLEKLSGIQVKYYRFNEDLSDQEKEKLSEMINTKK